MDKIIVDIYFQKETHQQNNCRHLFSKVDTWTQKIVDIWMSDTNSDIHIL